MSKNLTYEQKRRRYVRQQMKLSPPFGSEFVLYGSIIILLWALGELNDSYLYIKAWFAVDEKIRVDLGITHWEFIQRYLLPVPAAMDALKQLAMLCLGALMGLVGIFFRRFKISIPMLLCSMIVMTYEVPTPFWMKVLSYTRYIKLGGCMLIFTGSVCKIVTWFIKRNLAGERYDLEHKKKKPKQVNNARRDKTLIPARLDSGQYGSDN